MRKLAIALLALLTVGAVSLYFSRSETASIADAWKTSEPPVTNREPCSGIQGNPYPGRLPRSVLIPAQDTNIRIGYDCYVDNIKVERRVEFRDGKKMIIRYRADGTVSERTKHYATVNGDLGRVQSHATYAADGTTYTSHDVYRGDGTLERSGKGERDGRYTTRYFFDDGITVERLRNFSPLKEFVSERIYRRDGSELAAIAVTTDQLELGVTLYAPDGTRTATFYRTKVGERGYVFAPDGTTLLEYAFDPYTRVAGYMDARGRLMQKVDARFGRLVIAFLSRDETRTYVQTWRDSDKVLRKVEERDREGRLIRTIEMSRDGSSPELIIYPEEVGSSVKVLDDKGRVIRSKRLDARKNVVSESAVNESLNDPISTEALSVPPPTAEKPDFRLYGPPLVYDYE